MSVIAESHGWLLSSGEHISVGSSAMDTHAQAVRSDPAKFHMTHDDLEKHSSIGPVGAAIEKGHVRYDHRAGSLNIHAQPSSHNISLVQKHFGNKKFTHVYWDNRSAGKVLTKDKFMKASHEEHIFPKGHSATSEFHESFDGPSELFTRHWIVGGKEGEPVPADNHHYDVAPKGTFSKKMMKPTHIRASIYHGETGRMSATAHFQGHMTPENLKHAQTYVKNHGRGAVTSVAWSSPDYKTKHVATYDTKHFMSGTHHNDLVSKEKHLDAPKSLAAQYHESLAYRFNVWDLLQDACRRTHVTLGLPGLVESPNQLVACPVSTDGTTASFAVYDPRAERSGRLAGVVECTVQQASTPVLAKLVLECLMSSVRALKEIDMQSSPHSSGSPSQTAGLGLPVGDEFQEMGGDGVLPQSAGGGSGVANMKEMNGDSSGLANGGNEDPIDPLGSNRGGVGPMEPGSGSSQGGKEMHELGGSDGDNFGTMRVVASGIKTEDTLSEFKAEPSDSSHWKSKHSSWQHHPSVPGLTLGTHQSAAKTGGGGHPGPHVYDVHQSGKYIGQVRKVKQGPDKGNWSWGHKSGVSGRTTYHQSPHDAAHALHIHHRDWHKEESYRSILDALLLDAVDRTHGHIIVPKPTGDRGGVDYKFKFKNQDNEDVVNKPEHSPAGGITTNRKGQQVIMGADPVKESKHVISFNSGGDHRKGMAMLQKKGVMAANPHGSFDAHVNLGHSEHKDHKSKLGALHTHMQDMRNAGIRFKYQQTEGFAAIWNNEFEHRYPNAGGSHGYPLEKDDDNEQEIQRRIVAGAHATQLRTDGPADSEMDGINHPAHTKQHPDQATDGPSYSEMDGVHHPALSHDHLGLPGETGVPPSKMDGLVHEQLFNEPELRAAARSPAGQRLMKSLGMKTIDKPSGTSIETDEQNGEVGGYQGHPKAGGLVPMEQCLEDALRVGGQDLDKVVTCFKQFLQMEGYDLDKLQEAGSGEDKKEGVPGEMGSRHYKSAVAVILSNSPAGSRSVLLGVSTAKDDRHGLLCFPGGHIDAEDGHDPLKAAKREAAEESAVEVRPLIIVDWPEKPNVAFVVCEYIQGDHEPNQEFKTMEWFPIKSLEKLDNLHPGTQSVIQKIPANLVNLHEASGKDAKKDKPPSGKLGGDPTSVSLKFEDEEGAQAASDYLSNMGIPCEMDDNQLMCLANGPVEVGIISRLASAYGLSLSGFRLDEPEQGQMDVAGGVQNPMWGMPPGSMPPGPAPVEDRPVMTAVKRKK